MESTLMHGGFIIHLLLPRLLMCAGEFNLLEEKMVLKIEAGS